MGDLFRWFMGPAGFGLWAHESIRVRKRVGSLLVGGLGVVMLVGTFVGPSEGCSECWLDLAQGLGKPMGELSRNTQSKDFMIFQWIING